MGVERSIHKQKQLVKELGDLETEIQHCLDYLRQGQVILYPTDTVWGIGCDARNMDAIDKIYKIKERDANKPMLCMVSDFEMLKQYVEVSPELEAYLKIQERPTTVIYPRSKGLAPTLKAADGSIAIRVVAHSFCTSLIQKFGSPIVSTSANLSKQPTPSSYEEIEDSILERVDYIVNLQTEKKSQPPSRLIQIAEDGTISSLRE